MLEHKHIHICLPVDAYLLMLTRYGSCLFHCLSAVSGWLLLLLTAFFVMVVVSAPGLVVVVVLFIVDPA